MKVIGLTGSLAMGKSEVAHILRSMEIPVFDSDQEVHNFYASEEGQRLVAKLIPDAVVEGKVDRRILGIKVLANPSLLSELEATVHAEIKRRREHFLDRERKYGREYAALDIPLLFETGSEKAVDIVLVVSANPDIQLSRALARPGMTQEKFDAILARQLPNEEKRLRADYVIENNSSKADLKTQVYSIIEMIRKGAGPAKQ